MSIPLPMLFNILLANLYGGTCGEVSIIPPSTCAVYITIISSTAYLVSDVRLQAQLSE